ncbi:efflux RND transporter periplasmic adaptor subunit [Halomonas alkaliantarctica]|uniref:Efflux RND transporter periplasmic adaptor subunit n=1 Tax=Halomonas alkaliantarctica TaxID=232346 RepID=A0ABY8LKV2_9GAMM|nr:efflux RND transporter periplasmic adaptor subunit [Halomonas alkaliantarctica]WGI25073.1 efflux RND transporter periplasmic adaptor subunit [Halomonas alkaliantarctica]
MRRKNVRRLVLVLALLFLVVVFVYSGVRMAENKNNLQETPPVQEPQRPTVNVVEVTPGTYRASVEGVGSAEALFELDLNSRISGQVISVSDSFNSGRLVVQGEVLATLEDSQWQAELESAREAQAEALVSYLEEEQEAQQAEQEWSSSGISGSPLSTLALREPQLAAAQAALDSSRQAVAEAEKNLASTQIKAPFDAIVIGRSISPGSYAQAGNEIGQLLSSNRVEVVIPLSASDWSVLPNEDELVSGRLSVELTQMETGEQWIGSVIRTEKNLNSDTRQRALVVAVDEPLAQEPSLYPGTFLKAQIPGRSVANLWKLPASALSQREEILTVSDEGLLKAHPANIIFSDQQHIYVEHPEGYDQATVVIQPLSSYSEGMAVTPQSELSDD